VKGPSHGQTEAAEVTLTRGQKSKEPRKPDSEAHEQEVSPELPQRSLVIPAATGQAASAATSHRGDTEEICKPDTHPHQIPVTGALTSSTSRGKSLSCQDGSCEPIGTPSPSLLEMLRSQMDAGFQRRNTQFVQEVFNKYKTSSSLLPCGKLDDSDLD
jgi:hypothetical protein